MLRLGFAAFAAAVLALGLASAAEAGCTRLGFSVNDYGKDGPTKDAKELLDKHIADWAKQRGIGKYTVGKKDVSCELFLDFIVFDEHTCTAEATVCWPDRAAPAKPVDAKSPAPARSPKADQPATKRTTPAKAKAAVKSAATE
jgi:hypothetical protein